jgi:hypothetical protein
MDADSGASNSSKKWLVRDDISLRNEVNRRSQESVRSEEEKQPQPV